MSRSNGKGAEQWEIGAVLAIPRVQTRLVVGHVARQAYDIHHGRGFHPKTRLGNTDYIATKITGWRPGALGMLKQVDMQLRHYGSPPSIWGMEDSVLSATSNGQAFVNGNRAHATPYQPATIMAPELQYTTWLAAEGLGRLAVAHAIALGATNFNESIDIGRLPSLTTFWKAVYATGLMDQMPGTFPLLSNVDPGCKLPLDDLLPDVPPDFADLVSFQSPVPSAE